MNRLGPDVSRAGHSAEAAHTAHTAHTVQRGAPVTSAQPPRAGRSRLDLSSRRGRRLAGVVVGGFASALCLGTFTAEAFGAFNASLVTGNSLGTGTLIMTTSDGTTAGTCYSTASTSQISSNTAGCNVDLYGGLMTMGPGSTNTVNLTITNTGTLAAGKFTMDAGACSDSTNPTAVAGLVSTAYGTGSLCSLAVLTLKQTVAGTTTTIYTGAAGGLPPSKALAVPVAAGGRVQISATVALPDPLDDRYKARTMSQPLTFTFSSPQ